MRPALGFLDRLDELVGRQRKVVGPQVRPWARVWVCTRLLRRTGPLTLALALALALAGTGTAGIEDSEQQSNGMDAGAHRSV